MNTLVKEFVERCKEEFEPLGFIRKGESFVRVRNDVVQVFSLFRFASNHCCTINCGVYPICSKVLSIDVGRYDSKYWESVPNSGQWMYFCDEDDTIHRCVGEIITTITKHIIPFFDRATDSNSAFNECIKLEELFFYNRKKQLEAEGRKDCSDSTHLYFVHFFDYDKYYMSLKNKNYDFAIKFLKLMMEREVESYNYYNLQKNERPDDKIFYQERIVKSKQIIDCYKEKIRLLESGCYDSFNEEIVQNEEKNKKALKRYISKKNSNK